MLSGMPIKHTKMQLYNKAKYELEQQIKSLEEERDALLESYDEQIDKLGEVKDRWSEIADNIRIANEAARIRNLRPGWEIKVTTGEDKDIFDAMVKNYETVEAQKEMYQKQIDATEKYRSYGAVHCRIPGWFHELSGRSI